MRQGCPVFRIYMEYPRKPSGVPEYLVAAGVKLRAWPCWPPYRRWSYSSTRRLSGWKALA